MKAEFQEYLKALKNDGNILSVEKAFPKAASLELKNTYVVMLNGNASYEGMKNDLLASTLFEDVYVEYISAETCTSSSQTYSGLKGKVKHRIDSGDFTSGVYVIQVKANNGLILTSKLVIQK